MTDLARIGFAADTSGLKQAQRELDNTARHGQSAERKLDRSITNTNQGFKSLKSSVGLVGTALAALGSAALTRDLVKYSDTWKGVNSQIRQVTESEKELLAVRQMVVQTAKETRSDLEATTKLYTALDRATTHLGVSTEKQIELTKTINNLFLSGGKSAQEASGAIRQLTQGLESGALRGDEFNSVAENAPRILDALAASLGMARGELRDFAATGGITAEILVKALGDYNKEAQKLADQTEVTFGQNMEIATTNVTAFIGELDSVNSIVGSVGSGLVGLSANMDAVGEAVENTAILVGLALTPAILKYTAAQATALKATLTATTASTGYSAAMGIQAQRVGAATVATRALGLATSALMSPWGLLITAVGVGAATFIHSKNSVDELTGSISEMNKEVEKATDFYAKYLEMTGKSKNIDLAKMSQSGLQDQFDKSSKLIDLYVKRLGRLRDSQASLAKVTELETKLKLEQARLKEINKLLPNAATSYDKMSKAMRDLAERLDPALKAQRETAEATKILNSALNSGIIGQKEYNKYLSLVGASAQVATGAIDGYASATQALLDRLDPVSAAQRKYNDVFERLIELAADFGDSDEMTNMFKLLDDDLNKTLETLIEVADKTDEWQEITERAVDRIDQSFADVWLNISDGFESVTSGLIDSFKRMLAEMAHAAITRPIVMQIGAAMGLGGMSGMANAGGMMGGLGSILGVGGTGGIGGSILGMLGGGAMGLGTGIAGLGSALGIGGLGSFGAGMAMTGAGLGTVGIGGTMSSIGSLLGGGQIMAGLGAAMPIIAGIAGIAGLANSLTGGGLFGTSYKKTGESLTLGTSGGDVTGFTTLEESKKRSLFRGTKRRSTDTAFGTAAIEEIFTDLEASILGAAEMLDITGVESSLTSSFGGEGGIVEALTSSVTTPVEEWLNKFSSKLKINTEGMSEEQIQAEINSWVQTTTEAMIDGVFRDFLSEIQKEGESSASALSRAIANMEVFTSLSDTLGLNFSSTGEAAALAATNIVDLVGGLDNLSALSSQYYNAFFSEEERFDAMLSGLAGSFEQLGMSLPATRDEFRALVEGLDLTTEEGQNTFAMLMQLVPGMDAYFNELEKQVGAIQTLEQQLSSAMVEIEKAVDAEKDLARARLDAAGEAYQAALEAISAEKQLADTRLSSAQVVYQSQIEAISQQKSLLDSQHGLLTDNLSFAEQQLRDAFSVEKAGIQEASRARIAGLNQERSIVSTSMSRMISLANKMNQAAGVSVTVDDALKAARLGNFALAEQLNVSALTDGGFSSAEGMAFAQAKQNAQLREIGSLAGGKATAQDRLLETIERQIIRTEASASAQISKLDDQLNALLDIDTSIPDIADAILLHNQAKMDLDELNYKSEIEKLENQMSVAEQQLELAQKQYDDEMTKLDDQLSIAEQQLELARQQYDDEIARLDAILEDSQEQINVLLGIDTSVMSVADAVNSLSEIIQNASEYVEPSGDAGGEEQPVATDPAREEREEEVAEAIKASTRANTEAADILNKIYRGEISVRVVNP